MDPESVLDECLARIAAGESADNCLADHPDLARDLAPLLAAAQEVRVFSNMRLAQGQRLRAKVALWETLVGQRRPWRVPWWTRLGAAPVAALIAVTLFLAVTVTAVAGSQPGDLAYGVRVVVERAPVWVQVSDQGRASAELAVAERRLQDVTAAAEQSGEVPLAALNALVKGAEAAAGRATKLGDDEREEVATRVGKQAAELMRLAEAAMNHDEALGLREAAQRIARAAGKLRLQDEHPPVAPTPTVAGVLVTPTASPTFSPSPRPTELGRGGQPTEPAPARILPTRTPRPRRTAVVPTVAPTTVIQTVAVPATATPNVVAPTAPPPALQHERTVTPVWRATAFPIPTGTIRPRDLRATLVAPTVTALTATPATVVVPSIRPTREAPRRITPTPGPGATVTGGTPATPAPGVTEPAKPGAPATPTLTLLEALRARKAAEWALPGARPPRTPRP